MHKWKIILLAFCFLSIVTSISIVQADTQTVNPSDDAYVNEDSPNYKYGDLTYLKLSDTAFQHCRIWLKFSIPISNARPIKSAKLYLYQHGVPYKNMIAEVYYSADDSWSEDSITWNNQPSYSDLLDSTTIDGDQYVWYSWNVKSTVSSGDTVSFCLRTTTNNCEAWFRSREYNTYKPYLLIEYKEVAISLINLPGQLAVKWGISSFAAGLFMSSILIFAFLFPLVICEKSGIIVLVVAFSVMGFCTAIAWFPAWMLVILTLLVLVAYSSRIKEML